MTISTTEDPRLALYVFLVENHPDILGRIQTHLEKMGHQISTADTMEKAVAAVPSVDCDVLISDIGLMEGNGWELLHTLQLYRPIYAIAMSDLDSGANPLKIQAAGFRHHLLKPFHPGQLDWMLHEAVQEKKGENLEQLAF